MEKLIKHFVDQNPTCQFASVIVDLLTKEQLKILKSRLMFDPRKLPLTPENLAQSLHQADDNFAALQRDKFFRVIDEFECLVLPEQLEVLQSFAVQLSQDIEECEDDNRLDLLEELYGHVLNFLDAVQKR